MSKFVEAVVARAKEDPRHVVLPEGDDPRTLQAARSVVEQGIARVTVLGDPAAIDVEGAQVVDPRTSPDRDRYADLLTELRAKKGITREKALELLDDPLYWGVMMVKAGDADGMTAGACHATGDVLRPALQVIKAAAGQPLVSSFFEVTVPGHPELGQDGTLFFADCGLNTYPDSEQLAHIALQTARSWESLMGSPARVAMLSYSSMGSADDEHTRLVREAARIARELDPDLDLAGELQLDAALVPAVAAAKAPGVPAAGKANVLVFPNLDAGNIGYKIAQRLAGAEAIGPVLQGLAAPVNDLSRGCSADDIVGMVAMTALQAIMGSASRA